MKKSTAAMLLTSVVPAVPIGVNVNCESAESMGLVSREAALDMMACATKLYNGLLWHCEKKQRRYKWKTPPNDLPFLNQVLHKLPRKRALHSLVAQGVRDDVHEAIASHVSLIANGRTEHNAPKAKRKDQLTPLTWYMGNGCRLNGNVLTLSCGLHRMDGVRRIQFQLHTHPGQINFSKIQTVTLAYDMETGRFTAHLTGVPVLANPLGDSENPRRASLDLGMIVMAALQVEGGASLLYSGGLIRSTQHYWMKVRKNLRGPDKTHRASRRWKQVGRKESRQVDHLLHIISKNIVLRLWMGGVRVLAIGDLTGIRTDEEGESVNHGKAGNKYLHAWPFAKLVEYIAYKCKLQGIEIVMTDERDTSKTCHNCRIVKKGNRKTRGSYACDCGWRAHADVNGACNIFQKAFGVSPVKPKCTKVSPTGSIGCVAQPVMLGSTRHAIEPRSRPLVEWTGMPRN
jgi:IS605 OrfB family transposase